MKPPDNTGGYVDLFGSENARLIASMKPPDNTGGYDASSQPLADTLRAASMKPPDNTGGYVRRPAI